MALGNVGGVFGGILIGNIRDRFGNRAAVLSEIALTLPPLIIIIIFNEHNKWNYSAYLLCLLWGMLDSGLNMFIYCVLGFEFDSKSVPFSLF